MKRVFAILLLGLSLGMVAAVVVSRSSTEPYFKTVRMNVGTNPVASLAWAERPVLVRHNTTLECGPEELSGFVTVVCGEVIAVDLYGATGTTNELERSSDLTNWVPSNLRVVSDGTPFRCWVNTSSNQQIFFRAVKR